MKSHAASVAIAGASFRVTERAGSGCGYPGLQHIAALRPHVKLGAVTRGAAGSVILSKDGPLKIGAEAVEKVVDTTGAGDQYAAGFMFGLSRGRPLQQCGQLASLAAAEVISHYGPRPQVPLKDLAAAKGY